MSIIVSVLVIIAIMVALFLIVPLFIKNKYGVEREIIINKPSQEVFNYIKHLKNQAHYSKWVMTDPSMKKDFTGTDGEVGFIYAWDSTNKNAGKGEQEIKSLTEGKEVKTEVRFERPFKNTADIYTSTEGVQGNQTKVKWGMLGNNKYPMNIMNLFLGNMLGKDLEISLASLKNILEQQV